MELETKSLRIEFTRREDRFHHSLFAMRDGSWEAILTSVEGNAEVPWPPSPPWQQIVSEPIGPNGRHVLLGVGQSGSGHWSVSIDPNDSEGLLLDVACKVSRNEGFVGSTWRINRSWAVAKATPHEITMESRTPRSAIQLVATHGEFTIKQLPEIDQVEIVLHPIPVAGTTKPFRWAVLLNDLSDRHSPGQTA